MKHLARLLTVKAFLRTPPAPVVAVSASASAPCSHSIQSHLAAALDQLSHAGVAGGDGGETDALDEAGEARLQAADAIFAGGANRARPRANMLRYCPAGDALWSALNHQVSCQPCIEA